MARTTPMRLVELMVLRDDINSVVEFLAKQGNFQFQEHAQSADLTKKNKDKQDSNNPESDIFNDLQKARLYLMSEDFSSDDLASASFPNDDDRILAKKLIASVEELRRRELSQAEELKRVKDADAEARAFANLKVPYAELDHLSFLSLRIGRIDPSTLDDLKIALEGRAVIISLGEDKSRVLAASSKKARFALDNELKKFGFVNMEIPKEFKGIPDDVLVSLGKELEQAEYALSRIEEEKHNFALTHAGLLKKLLAIFSIGGQTQAVRNSLESTSLVYRITGWIPESDSHQMMNDLDKLTEGRIAIRVYQPQEVPSVARGDEKVPVKLKHGKLVGAFERMIFSYGSPLYGNIDPTPFVAIFFTLLFGIMFGDAGQGLVDKSERLEQICSDFHGDWLFKYGYGCVDRRILCHGESAGTLCPVGNGSLWSVAQSDSQFQSYGSWLHQNDFRYLWRDDWHWLYHQHGGTDYQYHQQYFSPPLWKGTLWKDRLGGRGLLLVCGGVRPSDCRGKT